MLRKRKASLSTLRPKTLYGKEQIPEGLIQQTMMGPTKVLDVTTGVQNKVAKL